MNHEELRHHTAEIMRRSNFMANLYSTDRPDQVIPLLPDAPTDVNWTTTTTWNDWANYISQRGKWAGGVECRALNEVFCEIKSNTRINFLSHEHQEIFGTELNSAQTNEILLLLRSGHFQLLLHTNMKKKNPESLKRPKNSPSKTTLPNSNNTKLKHKKGTCRKPRRAKRPRPKTTKRKKQNKKKKPIKNPPKKKRKKNKVVRR